jgi:hypothetical protein
VIAQPLVRAESSQTNVALRTTRTIVHTLFAQILHMDDHNDERR